MKIHKVKTSSIASTGDVRPSVKEIKQMSFSSTMRDAEERHFKEFIEKLLLDIDKQGDVLINNITFEEVGKYKELVKKFLQEVVARTYKFDIKTSINKLGKQKILDIIKKVDESLEELIKMVLKKEKNRLLILTKIGEIRGLLVDLIG